MSPSIQLLDDTTKNLEAAKVLIYGENDQEPKKQDVIDFATCAFSADLLLLISQSMEMLVFEAKRFASLVFNALVRAGQSYTGAAIEYILAHNEIMTTLLEG